MSSDWKMPIDPEVRVIEVEKEFYRKLLELLEPTERWHDRENGGIALWTLPAKKLVFKRRTSVASSSGAPPSSNQPK